MLLGSLWIHSIWGGLSSSYRPPESFKGWFGFVGTFAGTFLLLPPFQVALIAWRPVLDLLKSYVTDKTPLGYFHVDHKIVLRAATIAELPATLDLPAPPLRCHRVDVYEERHRFQKRRQAFRKLTGERSVVSDSLNRDKTKNRSFPSSMKAPTPFDGRTTGCDGPFRILTPP